MNKLNEIKLIQENIKKGNENIMKLDERIRKLLKGQVEQKHKIEVAMNNKSQLMKDIVTDHNKLIKELDQNFQQYALIFQLDFDINQYLLKNDLNVTSNISDIIIDYSEIEKKNKIEELTPEDIAKIISKKKEKLDNYLKEIQKYVMLYITFSNLLISALISTCLLNCFSLASFFSSFSIWAWILAFCLLCII